MGARAGIAFDAHERPQWGDIVEKVLEQNS
jgi:hypothetical protein